MAHGGDSMVLSQNCSLDTIESATPQLSPLYCGQWGNPTCEGGGGTTHPCPPQGGGDSLPSEGVVPHPHWLRVPTASLEDVGGLPHPNKEVMVGWPPTCLCPPSFFSLNFFLDFLFFCHKSISIKTLTVYKINELIT
jgi:hypothetical protein